MADMTFEEKQELLEAVFDDLAEGEYSEEQILDLLAKIPMRQREAGKVTIKEAFVPYVTENLGFVMTEEELLEMPIDENVLMSRYAAEIVSEQFTGRLKGFVFTLGLFVKWPEVVYDGLDAESQFDVDAGAFLYRKMFASCLKEPEQTDASTLILSSILRLASHSAAAQAGLETSPYDEEKTAEMFAFLKDNGLANAAVYLLSELEIDERHAEAAFADILAYLDTLPAVYIGLYLSGKDHAENEALIADMAAKNGMMLKKENDGCDAYRIPEVLRQKQIIDKE
ncbi:MAG: hypothetical protein IKD69_05845 [Solobacterium sp.]|nr:hypothetical protein [Solobacterium sp.]